jgi:CBS domain-containing protein
MKVRTLMRRPRAVLSAHANVADALAQMQEHGVGSLPVLDTHGLLTGLVQRDILSARPAATPDQPLDTITQWLAPVLVTATPEMDVGRLIELMEYKHLENIMVVEGRTLVGALTLDEARAALTRARAA